MKTQEIWEQAAIEKLVDSRNVTRKHCCTLLPSTTKLTFQDTLIRPQWTADDIQENNSTLIILRPFLISFDGLQNDFLRSFRYRTRLKGPKRLRNLPGRSKDFFRASLRIWPSRFGCGTGSGFGVFGGGMPSRSSLSSRDSHWALNSAAVCRTVTVNLGFELLKCEISIG